ncbi:WD40-repeat-containing domain protein [Lipomyces oligophaga]|uniref:WD40-repeat-containing domain protein n=1 Tax=Lipomyces oligophaga TaxID=45792 RepID=UPI0034CEED48
MNEAYILYGTSSLEGSKGEGTIGITKLHTRGANLRTFKQSLTASNKIAVHENCILAALTDRPIINIYGLKKEAPLQRIVVPEKLSCLCLSRSKKLLAAGTPTGKLILWEITSGSCLIYKEVHFGAINCLVFSHDDACLFTGGTDARIHCWSTYTLCSIQENYEHLKPVATGNQHSLSITGIYCGYGSIHDARLYSISDDASLRVWNASDLTLYSTFVFEKPLKSLVVDSAERTAFTGSNSGLIYNVPLYHSVQESTGVEYTGGLQKVVDMSLEDTKTFQCHQGDVLALDLSYDGTQLVSGGNDGSVIIWDIATLQVLHNLKTGKGVVHSTMILQNLPQDTFYPLESLKFTSGSDMSSSHNCWLTIPASVDSETEHFSLGSLEEPTMIQSPSSPPIEDSSRADRLKILELEQKISSMSEAYNKLWASFGEIAGNESD